MKRLTLVALVAVSLSSHPIAAQSKGDQTVFAVGTARASRGHTATGAIEVPAGSDAALSIPVAVVHGAKSGPVLALLAGAHGTEYASIIALEKLITTIDPAQLSGTVIIVPLLNVPSFCRLFRLGWLFQPGTALKPTAPAAMRWSPESGIAWARS